MNTITLHNKSDITYTQISNLFIDEYMPSANGSYVKVYLLLLRILSDYTFNISIPDMADTLELTESDIKRAFAYWEKKNLLYIVRNTKGAICDISVTLPSASPVKATELITETVPEIATTSECTEVKNENTSNEDPTQKEKFNRTYSSAEIKTITSQNDFKWIITIIEKYMERTLTPADVETAVFIYDSLHFSTDLVFYLYEYCISRGKKSARYIQTVAINWANEGVDTVDKAEQFSMRFETNYINVMKNFGLNGIPAPAQKKYIDSWLSAGFTPAIIKEACSRTLIAINEPNFKYANSILDNWKKLKVITIEDIKTIDEARAKSIKKDNAGPDKQRSTKSSQPVKQNSFNSYDQRHYSSDDYSSIEKQLLKK